MNTASRLRAVVKSLFYYNDYHFSAFLPAGIDIAPVIPRDLEDEFLEVIGRFPGLMGLRKSGRIMGVRADLNHFDPRRANEALATIGDYLKSIFAKMVTEKVERPPAPVEEPPPPKKTKAKKEAKKETKPGPEMDAVNQLTLERFGLCIQESIAHDPSFVRDALELKVQFSYRDGNVARVQWSEDSDPLEICDFLMSAVTAKDGSDKRPLQRKMEEHFKKLVPPHEEPSDLP